MDLPKLNPRQVLPKPFLFSWERLPRRRDRQEQERDVKLVGLEFEGEDQAAFCLLFTLDETQPLLPPHDVAAYVLDCFLVRLHARLAQALGDRPGPAAETPAPPSPGSQTSGD